MKLSFRFSIGLCLVLCACGGGGGESAPPANGGNGGGNTGPAAPSELAYAVPVANYVLNVPIESNVPSWMGTVNILSIQPALPNGLSFDSTTGAISGQPLVLSGGTTHMVTAEGPGGTATAQVLISVIKPPVFAYVTHGDDTLSIYSVDVLTGDLRHQGFQHAPEFEPGPREILVHPSGLFAWIANEGPIFGTNDVSSYGVDPDTGLLSAGDAISLGVGRHYLALAPDAETLYVVSGDSHLVQPFSIDDTNGALTPVGAATLTGTTPIAIEVDPAGRWLHTANSDAKNLRWFSIDAATGGLLPNSNSWGFFQYRPTDMDGSPDGKHLYVTMIADGGGNSGHHVRLMNVSQQSGDVVSGPSYSTGLNPVAITLHPSGSFAYVVNKDDGTLTVFRVEPSDGDLDPVETVDVGGDPIDIKFDPSGSSAYVIFEGQNSVRVFDVDLENGDLSAPRNVRTRPEPSSIFMSQAPTIRQPVASHVYCLARDSQEVRGFQVNYPSGELAALTPQTLAGLPDALALDHLGRFAYVANRDSESIEIYRIDPATGALSVSTPAQPLDASARGLAADLTGDYLFVALTGANMLRSYLINPLDGSLTFEEQISTEINPSFVSVDPTGQFVFVSNQSSSSVQAFFTRKGSFPSAEFSVPVGAAPGEVRFSAAGDRALVLSRSEGLLHTFDIDEVTGQPTSSASGNLDFGTTALDLAISADGTLGYASLLGVQVGSLLPFNVPMASMPPVAGTPIEFPPRVLAMRIDPTGRFLYAADQTLDSLSVYTIGMDTIPVFTQDHAAGGGPGALVLRTQLED